MDNEGTIIQEENVQVIDENSLDNSEQNDNNENQINMTEDNTEVNAEPAVVETPAEPEVEPVDPSNVVPVDGEFAKKDEDEDKDPEKDADNKDDDDEDDEEKKKYELLNSQHQELQANYAELEQRYTALEAEHAELLAFKQRVEDAEKDAMINNFSMLSDEDKREVIENKSKYSLDEIESKLSVICVRNRINFAAEDKAKDKPIVTFNLDNAASTVPAWIAACEKTQNNRK